LRIGQAQVDVQFRRVGEGSECDATVRTGRVEVQRAAVDAVTVADSPPVELALCFPWSSGRAGPMISGMVHTVPFRVLALVLAAVLDGGRRHTGQGRGQWTR
jgi:hypothetical protein